MTPVAKGSSLELELSSRLTNESLVGEHFITPQDCGIMKVFPTVESPASSTLHNPCIQAKTGGNTVSTQPVTDAIYGRSTPRKGPKPAAKAINPRRTFGVKDQLDQRTRGKLAALKARLEKRGGRR